MIAISQKGILAFKLSSHKVQSVWQQLQSTYLSQGSLWLLCICPRFHKQLHQSKERKSYLTCLRRCKTVHIPVKNMENKLTTKFPVSFKNTVQNSFHYLLSSGRFKWLTTCPNQTHSQLQFKLHPRLPDASEKSNQLSQTGKHSSLRCQLTVSTPSSTVPPVPWRFLSLSLSTLVPTLPGKQQCFRLQFQGHQSVQTSVKLHCSCTLLNLRCSLIHALHCKCGN